MDVIIMLMQPRWALTFRMLTFSVPTFAKDTGLPLGWTIKRWVKLSFGGKWKAVGGLFDLRREPQHVSKPRSDAWYHCSG